MAARRPLHYVFKLAEREKTIKFYTDILGMKVLRHEEFSEGCEATCNGPYNNAWSKTMIGYGSEDDHFVVELTYNYGIKEYERSNDFLKLTIHLEGVKEKLDKEKYSYKVREDGALVFRLPYSPNYEFHVVSERVEGDPIRQVTLASSNIEETTKFWQRFLQMTIVGQKEDEVVFNYPSLPTFTLRFKNNKKPVEHKSAEGRIAFSCPAGEQEALQEASDYAGYRIKNRLTTLPTPGKADVRVVILLDPDEHEICFVNDDAYRQLSQYDPKGVELLQQAIEKENTYNAKKGEQSKQ
ncbi:hypothetical protein RvY_05932 [Ramazzottius varieornatus]|uniref:VOC domain-containing protein n=1 Tax=Ramazzottius varieornatus TaxID=947166 RepID=A0A1D1UZS2_RAMVA|nr:hypothetical protein RvY_05932 [Ramazzottius varieornatus]